MNKLDRTGNHTDTSQAFYTLFMALKYKISAVYKGLKNPFALVVIVLLLTALVSVSLWKDNKVPFKEIILYPTDMPTQTDIKKVDGEKNEKKLSKKKKSQTGAVIQVYPPNTDVQLSSPSVQKAFVENYSVLAIAEMDRTGIPASVILAQAVLESVSGSSMLFKKHNAAFGIKCFSKTCSQGHCRPIVIVHNGDHHKDFYRVYPSVQASFTDHSGFLLASAYKQLLKFGKDYKSWAHGLQNLGYAADSQYAQKLISIIEKNELNRLDDL